MLSLKPPELNNNREGTQPDFSVPRSKFGPGTYTLQIKQCTLPRKST